MIQRAGVLVLLDLLLAGHARAAVIQMTTADNWTKLESAKAGDTVEIAPGTYQFRVMLAQQGTAASPITIRAKDPANRPVWDLGGKAVSAWPGSYTAGDKGAAAGRCRARTTSSRASSSRTARTRARRGCGR